MFTLRLRDRGVSCVKLPAAVAFPIDSELLDRLEQSRRALPPDSIKALWKSRNPQGPKPPPAPTSDVAHATLGRFPARVEAQLRHLVRCEDGYARGKVAVGQR